MHFVSNSKLVQHSCQHNHLRFSLFISLLCGGFLLF